MKVPHSILSGTVHALGLAGILVVMSCGSAAAQANSWISSSSGDWESPDWSLGLPATNQDIFLTNAGLKSIIIEPITVQNYPQTLTIKSLTISSPDGLGNAVLMNNAGFGTPLLIGDTAAANGNLTIADTNSFFEMLSSSLVVNGLMTVNGAFNFSNSLVTVPRIETVSGTMTQQGGTNLAGNVKVLAGGAYDLYAGSVVAGTQLMEIGGQPGIYCLSGTFNQFGGNVSAPLSIVHGAYNLSGGKLACGDLAMPPANSQALFGAIASINQSGGTNIMGSVVMGGSGGTAPSANGPATYTLSGGVLMASSFKISSWAQQVGVGYEAAPSSFTQSGGFFTNSGDINIVGTSVTEKFQTNVTQVGSTYNLSAGSLATGSITTYLSSFNQSGGGLTAGTLSGTYSLTGGSATIQDLEGDVQQSGGTNGATHIGVVTSYALSGGALFAQNVDIHAGAVFQHTGGSCAISGTLSLTNGTWQEGTNGAQLGQLQLGAGNNSLIQLSSNASVLRFTDSSKLAWSSNGLLTIANWSGSVSGGGTNRILFGASTNALTAQQLSQIRFANPVGVPAGTYPATILTSGEIVPKNIPVVDHAPAPFFVGEVSLGAGWYYLATSNQVFGYYNMTYFPYLNHLDLGWEYFIDAGNVSRGGYFYDFTDGVFFYTDPNLFPYLYDFNLNTWVYYAPQAGTTDRYTSNPRWFYSFAAQAWVNHL